MVNEVVNPKISSGFAAVSKNNAIFPDSVALERSRWRSKYAYYHSLLNKQIRFLIEPKSRILDIGCDTGELLESLNPVRGVGLDFSPALIKIAREKFPNLDFADQTPNVIDLNETFDYIMFSNSLGYLDNIQQTLAQVQNMCKPQTRIIATCYNQFWRPFLRLAEWCGLRMNWPEQNWLSVEDVKNLFNLAGYEVIRVQYCILLPIYILGISSFVNRILVNFPFFWRLAFNFIVVARSMDKAKSSGEPSCSIIIPCRNERGNIEDTVSRVPELGKFTELIFVEGHSRDGTLQECYRVKDLNPDRSIQVLVQDGEGKADAVRKGFAHARGDILLILDADLTTSPEELESFYVALVSGKGEFVNGSRLVYRMEQQAMRFLNMLGNKFFSVLFTYILGQYLKDTLCGTKALWRSDYDRISIWSKQFGVLDPFGDFELLFGAAKLSLKIVEIPVRYFGRTYGSTQIKRFQHGFLLLKMSFSALSRIKFI